MRCWPLSFPVVAFYAAQLSAMTSTGNCVVVSTVLFEFNVFKKSY